MVWCEDRDTLIIASVYVGAAFLADSKYFDKAGFQAVFCNVG